jgi:hypothetical protein
MAKITHTVPTRDHLAELPSGIDVHQREWDWAGVKHLLRNRSMAEESLPIE